MNICPNCFSMSPDFVYLHTMTDEEYTYIYVQENNIVQASFEDKVLVAGGSIIVWAAISSEGRRELVVIQNGSLTLKYLEEILIDKPGPFFNKYRRKFHSSMRKFKMLVLSAYEWSSRRLKNP